MLNKKPIFNVVFDYGGSNILLNLLQSYPEVQYPKGETHQLFRGNSVKSFETKIKKLRYYYIEN